jgi:hypothetical protein
MAAVTQSIPSFLGGVSKQSDIKKQPGQVNELLNGYPDPTYGLLKRNGAQFLGLINEGSDDFTDAHWFQISRDNDERYIGVILKTGNIRIWNTVPIVTNGVLSLTEATIANKGDADVVAYLTASAIPQGTVEGADEFHTFSYLDQTYIINKTKVVTMVAKSDYYLRTRATVVIGSIDYDSTYSIWINGTAYNFKTISLEDAETRNEPVTVDEILTGLKTAIDAALSATFDTIKYSNSLEIEVKDGQTPFTIEVKGGVTGVSLNCYQDDVSASARLAAYSKPGRRVKITNSIDERSSYYVKFVSTGNIPGGSGTVNAGSGYWEEARGWDIDVDDEGNPIATGGKFIAKLASSGFNATTMPYKLVNTATNSFTISKEEWVPRFTGNDYGNPVPSFVDKAIKFGLIYSNRLVFLTNDSIALSVAKDFENFFFASAQTVIASDPVDVETSSPKVSNLYCATPQAQGLVMFSEYEQYLLYSESGIISPTDVIVRTISQYEADRGVIAQDVGDFIGFVSKSAGSTKFLGMQVRGNLAAAEVAEVSRVASGYLPKNVQSLVVNVQDSLAALYESDSDTIFFYKYYRSGDEQLLQAWFKWNLVSNIKFVAAVDNYFIIIVKEQNEYSVLSVDVTQGFDKQEVEASPGIYTARLDRSFVVKSGGTITYNNTTGKSTIPKPYNHINGKVPIVLTVQTMIDGTGADYENLFKLSPTPDPTVTHDVILEVEVDGSGNWLVNGDWTGKEYDLVAGYEFNFDVELPRYFYKSQDMVDWTSSLTIARMKFDVGLSGSVNFYINRFGSPEWRYVAGVQNAGLYLANSSPTIDRTTLIVPIHQKNINFNLRLNSNSPFPVSLNGMFWEGQYAPRYYRRAGKWHGN